MKIKISSDSPLKELPLIHQELALSELFGIPDKELLDGESFPEMKTIQDVIEYTRLSEEKVLQRLERFLSMNQNPELSCQELKEILTDGEEKKTILLDVREEWEFETAKIEGAVLLKGLDLSAFIKEAAENKAEIITICHHGVRSFNAAMYLRQQGLTRVRSLKGGIDQWSLTIDPSVPRY